MDNRTRIQDKNAAGRQDKTVSPWGRDPQATIRILRPHVVADRCGVHQLTVRRWATDPKYADLGFPKLVQVGDNTVGFYEHEIDEYLANLPRTKATQTATAQAAEAQAEADEEEAEAGAVEA